MQPSPPAAAEARRPLSRLLMTTTTTLAALLLLLVPGAVAFRPPAAAATAAAATERRARLSSAPFGLEQQLPLADASQQRCGCWIDRDDEGIARACVAFLFRVHNTNPIFWSLWFD